MSVPFSNTHLRVPRGFGSILELLAKEVLRDQPQDIPTFAALYFEALLKEREESGMDPAEWAAKLEDRFYNNHSFKSSRGLSPTKVPAAASLNSVSSEEKIELSEAKNSPAMGGESSELSESEGSDEKEDATNKDLIPASPALSQDGAGRGLPDAADFSDEGRGWTEEGEEELADTDQGRATDGDGGQSEPEPYEPASFGRAADGDEGSGGLRTTEEGGEEPELGWQEAMSEEEEEEEWAELHGQASIPGLAGVDVCAEELGEAAGQPAGAAGERGFSQDLKDEEEIFAAHDSSEPLMEEGRGPFSPGQPSSPEASLQEVMRHSEKVLEEEQGETQTDSRETLESVPTAVDIHQHQPEAAGKDPKRSAQASPEEGSEVCDENQTLEEGLGQVQAPEDVTEEDTTGPHQPAAPNQGDGHVQSQDEAMEPSAETEPAEEHPVQAGAVEMASPHDAAHTGIEKDMDDDRDRRDDEGEGDGLKADESTHLQYSNETAGKEEGGADEHDEGRSESTEELEAHHTPTAAAGTERTPEGDWEDTPRGGQDVERRGTDVSHPLDVSEKEEETTDEAEGEVEEEKACEEGDEKEMGAQETTGLDLSGTEDEAGGEREGEGVGEDRLPGEEDGREEEGREEEGREEEGKEEETRLEKKREEEEKEEDPMEQQASDTPVQVPTEDGKMEPEEQDHLSTVGDEVTVPSSQSTGPAEEEHQEPRVLGDAVLKEDVEAEAGEKEPCSAPQEEEDIMDIPLDDPEANKAAAKIQAGFRGHMTRKKMKPEDEKAGEEVSSSGEALNGSQGDTEPGGSGGVELEDTSVPEQ